MEDEVMAHEFQYGFEEAQSAFQAFGAGPRVGDVRRFGAKGPAYEVLEVKPAGDVLIEVIESGERLVYGRQDFAQDPVAVTVP
jgi:hypothetical protein